MYNRFYCYTDCAWCDVLIKAVVLCLLFALRVNKNIRQKTRLTLYCKQIAALLSHVLCFCLSSHSSPSRDPFFLSFFHTTSLCCIFNGNLLLDLHTLQ